jgi:hypothetical protein
MFGVPIIKLNHLLIKPFYPVHKKYHEYVVYLCNFVTSNMFSLVIIKFLVVVKYGKWVTVINKFENINLCNMMQFLILVFMFYSGSVGIKAVINAIQLQV